jgi:Tol biopolymer transport system component
MFFAITGLALTSASRVTETCDGPAASVPRGTIAFSSLGPRGWDLYAINLRTRRSRRLTDHPALDYNPVFSPDGQEIAFVSERHGNMELYVMSVGGNSIRRLTNDFALDDHPAWSPDGKRIAFVSSREPARVPGQAWNAVYMMNSNGSDVHRLSPPDRTDYSPAWSPKGDLIAFASGSGKARFTDVLVMKPDGSSRRLVVRNAGWPSFAANGQALFFHSLREGNWGIWRVNLDGSHLERITSPDVEAFTPRASLDGRWLVLAVNRGSHRQIELMDLSARNITALTNEATDHWNPSISADGAEVVYHKTTSGAIRPDVERWGAPPGTGLKLLRLAGSFPAFSPDGKHLALVGDLAQLDTMDLDGSSRTTLYSGDKRGMFSTGWSRGGDRIAFAVGGVFEKAGVGVDLMTIRPDGRGLRKLTQNAGNNGFPSYSPDGKQMVFRSGRKGVKNLYIMNSDGTGLKQLTEGNWTDTMCDWSPTGEWIVFSSDRDGDFEIWLIRPDGSGLRKVIFGGGRNNHPHFSPDGRWIVFTSERAGYSAEEISLPFQFQPYGDLFAVQLDGSGLIRLTHNGFEEGTPAWGPAVELEPSSEGRKASEADY